MNDPRKKEDDYTDWREMLIPTYVEYKGYRKSNIISENQFSALKLIDAGDFTNIKLGMTLAISCSLFDFRALASFYQNLFRYRGFCRLAIQRTMQDWDPTGQQEDTISGFKYLGTNLVEKYSDKIFSIVCKALWDFPRCSVIEQRAQYNFDEGYGRGMADYHMEHKFISVQVSNNSDQSKKPIDTQVLRVMYSQPAFEAYTRILADHFLAAFIEVNGLENSFDLIFSELGKYANKQPLDFPELYTKQEDNSWNMIRKGKSKWF